MIGQNLLWLSMVNMIAGAVYIVLHRYHMGKSFLISLIYDHSHSEIMTVVTFLSEVIMLR